MISVDRRVAVFPLTDNGFLYVVLWDYQDIGKNQFDPWFGGEIEKCFV